MSVPDRATLLVIADDVGLANLLQTRLAGSGHRVLTADTAEAAFQSVGCSFLPVAMRELGDFAHARRRSSTS